MGAKIEIAQDLGGWVKTKRHQNRMKAILGGPLEEACFHRLAVLADGLQVVGAAC